MMGLITIDREYKLAEGKIFKYSGPADKTIQTWLKIVDAEEKRLQS